MRSDVELKVKFITTFRNMYDNFHFLERTLNYILQ